MRSRKLARSKNLAITPSVQLILDRALNPVDDEVWVWGLGMRLTFQDPAF